MTTATRSLLALALLALITLGSWWLARQAETRLAQRTPSHGPDYYLDRFSAVTTGPDGRPERRLEAARMVHFPDDDRTELTAPRMTFYDPPRPPWEVRSETGRVAGDRSLVELLGRVEIDREAAPGVRPMHIVTRDLRIRPEQEYAETDAEVDARSDRSWVRGRGMQAWFGGPPRIRLLANVRGRYDVE